MHTYRFWSPLLNVSLVGDVISLTNTVSFRRFTDFEKGELLPEIHKRWTHTKIRMGDHVIEVLLTKEEAEPEPDHYLPDARLEIEKVITLLRLFKEGICGFNLIVQAYLQGEPYGYSANTLLHYIPYTSKPEPWFELNEAEIEGFKAFFSEYDTPAYTQLSLARDYFNKSYIEPYSPRDSLLDLVVALEFLLLKGIKDELAYRLSTRAAFLLGGSAEERKKIYQSVKKAYKLRSKVIHGEKFDGELTSALMLEIRHYTRLALKIFLKKPALRDRLDDTILQCGSI